MGKRIEIGAESAPYALQQTLDSGYILTGYMKQIVNEPSKLVIAKFDSSGVFEFGKLIVIVMQSSEDPLVNL